MSLFTNPTSVILWQDAIKSAEERCAIKLNAELEAYLISLLIRYTNKPELVEQLFATAFLKAMQSRDHQRQVSLQHVGDQCLLFAGLFPGVAEKRQVKVKYFVDLGRSAYVTISAKANDLYWSLAFEFIALMDVLQSINHYSHLMPLAAYEQWNELGSKRALKILRNYTEATPFKNTKW